MSFLSTRAVAAAAMGEYNYYFLYPLNYVAHLQSVLFAVVLVVTAQTAQMVGMAAMDALVPAKVSPTAVMVATGKKNHFF